MSTDTPSRDAETVDEILREAPRRPMPWHTASGGTWDEWTRWYSRNRGRLEAARNREQNP